MTLIVCLKAQDCIVFAADSITTVQKNGADSVEVVSCDTRKLHSLSGLAIAAGAGTARIRGRYWSDRISGFAPSAATIGLADLAQEFKSHLNVQMAEVSNDVGARIGGNTFLIAGFDSSSGGFAVLKTVRGYVHKEFGDLAVVSDAGSSGYIEFIGDTEGLATHIAQVTSAYVPTMDRKQAELFAVKAISDGILAAQAAGLASVGGKNIYVATVDRSGVQSSMHPSGVNCP